MFIPFALTLGAALSSKASAVLFIPITAMLVLLNYRRTRKMDWRTAAAWCGAVLGAVLVAGMVFVIASRHSTPVQTTAVARGWLGSRAGAEGAVHMVGTLARFSTGAAQAWFTESAAFRLVQNRGGVNYIFGQRDTAGFWYYFPAAWIIKSPLPYLLLLGFCLFRREWDFRAAFLWVPVLLYFAASLGASFNIGVRHLSLIFPLAAVFIGMRVGGMKRASWIASIGALVLAVTATWAYPNYLSHFDLLFSHKPERFLVDSNLDWGQDWKRAAEIARENGWTQVVAVYIGTASPERYFAPPAVLYAPGMPVEKDAVYAVSIQARTVGPDILRLYNLRGEADALQDFLRRLEGPEFRKLKNLPGIEFYLPKGAD